MASCNGSGSSLSLSSLRGKPRTAPPPLSIFSLGIYRIGIVWEPFAPAPPKAPSIEYNACQRYQTSADIHLERFFVLPPTLSLTHLSGPLIPGFMALSQGGGGGGWHACTSATGSFSCLACMVLAWSQVACKKWQQWRGIVCPCGW